MPVHTPSTTDLYLRDIDRQLAAERARMDELDRMGARDFSVPDAYIPVRRRRVNGELCRH